MHPLRTCTYQAVRYACFCEAQRMHTSRYIAIRVQSAEHAERRYTELEMYRAEAHYGPDAPEPVTPVWKQKTFSIFLIS